MFVYEITIPGTHLDYAELDWCWRIQNQLYLLQSQFFEANLALNLFIYERSSKLNSFSLSTFEENSKRKQEIRKMLEIECIKAGGDPHMDYDEISLQTDILFKREKWQQGEIPREFSHNLAFLYARAFLYALDAFDKFLGVLAKEENVPDDILELHKKIPEIFPDLRGVRNTSQHMEDRSRGLGAGKNPKPLDLKAINNNFININGGTLILNSLNGSKYGSTMANGHYGEVDVSPESLDHLQKILNGVLRSFKWKGLKQHMPSI